MKRSVRVSDAELRASRKRSSEGAIAQLGERLVCNQKVAGSIPAGSTTNKQSLRAGANVPALLFNNPESFCFDAKFSSES